MKFGILDIFGALMALVYTSLGVFLIFGPAIFSLTDPQQTGLGIVVFIYGLFRIYNVFKKKKEEMNMNDEE